MINRKNYWSVQISWQRQCIDILTCVVVVMCVNILIVEYITQCFSNNFLTSNKQVVLSLRNYNLDKSMCIGNFKYFFKG